MNSLMTSAVPNEKFDRIPRLMLLFVIYVSGVAVPAFSQIPAKDDRLRIENLIQQLQATSYQKRSNASRQLADLGNRVIEPLFDAIESKDVETSFRAINIIKQVGMNSDLDTLEMIIRRSRDLPDSYRFHFDGWIGKAISQWKETQSKKAVRQLASQGAEIIEVEELAELRMMLIDEMQERVDAVRKETKPASPDAVLREIAQLKKELAGELVDPGTQRKPQAPIVVRNANAIIQTRLNVVESASGVETTPYNISFGSEWKGTHRDLAKMRFIGNINQLEFVEQQVTPEMLGVLKTLPNIQSLLLTRCRFQFSELRKFKDFRDSQSPIRIMATGPGYLGVYGPTSGEPEDGNGSFVSMVSPNSAASEAGLIRGDRIVQIDDDEIRSFFDLSLVISTKPVGEKIRIVVKRDDRKTTLTAVLKSRVGIR